MDKKRHSWHVNDPDDVLKPARQLVKMHKLKTGAKTEAEALAVLIMAGSKALEGQYEAQK